MATDRDGRPVLIRKAKPDDQGYITRTWVASVMDATSDAHGVSWRLNREVDRLLDDPLTRLLVAHPEGDERRIVGFVAYAGRTLLFVNVRSGDRQRGVGSMLLREAGLHANGKPVLYVYDGPSANWAKFKRPDATKITLEEHLS